MICRPRLGGDAAGQRHLQPLAVPVLLTEAVNVDLAGAPIEASFGCYAADRVQLVTEAGEG